MLTRLAQAHRPWCWFQADHACPEAVAAARVGRAGVAVQPAAHEVAEGVAAEDVEAHQDGVRGDEQDPDAQAQVAVVPEGQPQVDPEHGQRDEGEVQEEAVRVHEDEGEAVLHAVAAVDGGLAHGTGRRIGEEGLVVGAPEVVAGGPEEDLDPEHQDGRREPGRQDGLAEGDREEGRVVALGLVVDPEVRDEEDRRDRGRRR